jgi:hypothetical protein
MAADHGRPHRGCRSAFDESNLSGPRALGGFLLGEFDALPLAQQLEHRSPHGATMEEMLSSTLIANEAEAFIDEETCNRPGLHTYPPLDEHFGAKPTLRKALR